MVNFFFFYNVVFPFILVVVLFVVIITNKGWWKKWNPIVVTKYRWFVLFLFSFLENIFNRFFLFFIWMIRSVFLFFIWLFLSKYDISDARILISITRIFLLFRISRFSNHLKSFELTFKKSLNELTTFVIYLSITIVFFSSILYYCEKDSNPKFSSIPETLW